jgi:hypothetical protein
MTRTQAPNLYALLLTEQDMASRSTGTRYTPREMVALLFRLARPTTNR